MRRIRGQSDVLFLQINSKICAKFADNQPVFKNSLGFYKDIWKEKRVYWERERERKILEIFQSGFREDFSFLNVRYLNLS